MITEAPCAVCRARANSGHKFGYRNQPILHACKDPRCQALLPKVYKMTRPQLDAFEEKAIKHGGHEAGAYLDSLGKYNLAEMTDDEWATFCACLVKGYGEHMKWMLENNEAPF